MAEDMSTQGILFDEPNAVFSSRELFGIDSDWQVPGFAEPCAYTPARDAGYRFDEETTLAILSGFIHNRRVLVQGFHGTGKSTHIEQVAARLNYPCLRVNLDSHISRIDLVGKDTIVLQDGKQVTSFQEGILTWALQRPIALCFDEYDAGRPDVMFVIQRVLEVEGCLTLLDQSRIIQPHKFFRLFATANTVGLGDTTGLYQGTQQINQGQIDRWHIMTILNYLQFDEEVKIVRSKVPHCEAKLVQRMVRLAEMSRRGFSAGDVTTVMSPRTVIGWAENLLIFKDIEQAFRLTFLNKCDESEKSIFCEYYQRCFDRNPLETSSLKEDTMADGASATEPLRAPLETPLATTTEAPSSADAAQ